MGRVASTRHRAAVLQQTATARFRNPLIERVLLKSICELPRTFIYFFIAPRIGSILQPNHGVQQVCVNRCFHPDANLQKIIELCNSCE